MIYQKETDAAYRVLRQKTTRILAAPSETQDDLDWRAAALADAYRGYGIQADMARGVEETDSGEAA